jgi:protocatechuate 3,4-dioxygenase beta subunit
MKPVNLCVLALIAVSIGIPISAISTAREQDPAQEPTSPIAATAIPAKDPNPNPIAKNEIGGFVVDQEGKPIAGAIVDAYSWVPGHVTRTNQDGSFRLNVEVFGYLVEPEVEMRVTKPGYCPKTFAKVKTGTTVPNIVLKDNTWLEGTVFDRTGKPVADATVRARTPAMRDGREIGSYWTETKSGADGRYVLHIEPAEIEIHSTVKGSGVFISPSVRLNEGQTMRVDVKLRSGGTLRAKVVDSMSGEPVAGLRMMKWLQNRTFEFEGQSGKDGIISITEIPPSIVDFNIEALGYARWWSEESHSVWNRKSTDLNDPRYGKWQRNFDGLNFEIGEGTKEVTIFVEKEVTIRGTVLDPDGKHVAGATVAPALTGSGNSLTGDTRFSVKSDESGNYEMKLPASGERVYNLVVHDGDYMTWRNWANGVSRTITTKPGEVLENFDISLTRPASVRGRVLDTSGKPVVNREVRTSAEDTMENRYYDPTTKTDAEGRFELKFVRPGTHFVQLHPFYLTAKDAPEGTSHTIHVKAGDSVEGIQFVPPIEFEPRQ